MATPVRARTPGARTQISGSAGRKASESKTRTSGADTASKIVMAAAPARHTKRWYNPVSSTESTTPPATRGYNAVPTAWGISIRLRTTAYAAANSPTSALPASMPSAAVPRRNSISRPMRVA